MVPLPFHQTFLVELALARAMLERIVLLVVGLVTTICIKVEDGTYVLLLELTTDFVVLVTFVDVLLLKNVLEDRSVSLTDERCNRKINIQSGSFCGAFGSGRKRFRSRGCGFTA